MALATVCTAQSIPSNATSSPARPHRRVLPGGERSMKGCIAKDLDGDLFLVPPHGKKVPLSGSTDLGSHVGQQVKLSGAFVDADERDTGESASPKGGGTSASKLHTAREFRVLKVDVLSSTCAPEGWKKK